MESDPIDFSHLGPRAYALGWALVGGGGADFTGDFLLSAGYKLSERTALLAGYRHLEVDYRKHGFVFDAVQSGPMLGLDVRF